MSDSQLQTVYDGGDVQRIQPTLTRRTDEMLSQIAEESQKLSKSIVAYEMILLGNHEYDDVFSTSEGLIFKNLEEKYGSDVRQFFTHNEMVIESDSRRILSDECSASGDDVVDKIDHVSLWIPNQLAAQLRGSRGINDKIERGLCVYVSSNAQYNDRLNRSDLVSELVSAESVDDVPSYIVSLIECDDGSTGANVGDVIASVLSDSDSKSEFEETEEEQEEQEEQPHWEDPSYEITSLMFDDDLPQDKRRLEAFCCAYNHYFEQVKKSEYHILTPHKLRADMMEYLDISKRTAYNYMEEINDMDSDYKIVGHNVIKLGVSDFKNLLKVVDRAVDSAEPNQLVVAPETLNNYTAYGRAQPDEWQSGEHLRIIKKVNNHNESV